MRGFSLIELMIVVAIIAILAGLAVSSYLRYAQQSRRSDAYAALSQDQGILERCYALTFSYANVSSAANGCPSMPATSPSGYYTVALASTSSTYTITATPVTGGPQAGDTACPSFSVDNTGTKTPSPTTSSCWQQ
ncbi:type IV pilin protein [Rhodanobacter sp. Si-c]|uniref:Type IV pilin protein n=1 Tax=Rhodanobacter lycopersici TaxID=3162487 RepID=A0ABV3QH18_9GAMM